MEIKKIPYAINSKLKKSVRIKSAEEVEESFHSRYSCKGKKYRYIINNSSQGSAVYRDLEYHVPQKLNIEKMNKAIKQFKGKHDFSSFKASGTSSKNSIRTVYEATIKEEGDRIYIEFTGSGFLYNMVRILAGTLVDVGLGKIDEKDITSIINSKNRKNAGKTLPPQGLYLVEVYY